MIQASIMMRPSTISPGMHTFLLPFSLLFGTNLGGLGFGLVTNNLLITTPLNTVFYMLVNEFLYYYYIDPNMTDFVDNL